MTAEEQINARIHLSPEAPHRLRRAEDRERMALRLKSWELWINLSARQVTPFDALQQVLDEYESDLAALAIRRLGVRGTRA